MIKSFYNEHGHAKHVAMHTVLKKHFFKDLLVIRKHWLQNY